MHQNAALPSRLPDTDRGARVVWQARSALLAACDREARRAERERDLVLKRQREEMQAAADKGKKFRPKKRDLVNLGSVVIPKSKQEAFMQVSSHELGRLGTTVLSRGRRADPAINSR